MDLMLENSILNKHANIAVIGLGYVGLPIAIRLSNVGFKVFGIDISEEKVHRLNSGKSYIIDIHDEDIDAVINKNLYVESDYSILSDIDVIIICVPTPLTEAKQPDVSYINNVVDNIIKYLSREVLIVLESTTYPGSTEELITAVIEKRKGLTVGKDFFVCYSPERVDPSNKKYEVKNTPKVIGGATNKCLEIGIALYKSFVDTIVPVSSTQVAELAKLFENTFRSVNIALVNELTQMADRMGLNIWEVIDAASTKPFGFMTFYPSAGVGGHCIPIDPIYLSWKAKVFNHYNRFIELATDINMNMPRYVVNQIAEILSSENKCLNKSNILIVGIAYKKDVDDLRESAALEIFHLLQEKGAEVTYHDPYVSNFKSGENTIFSQELTKANLVQVDLVVIIADHSNIDYQLIIDNSGLIYDTRNITKNYRGNNIVLLGGYRKDNNKKAFFKE
ncbi:nucleotide sugar dehydrogenase [Alkaliphilus sp. MSJ-5]|uniref:Nucleotide sugar dehydrogenase n=1 Tax=Alkaliphilus flagellatus TaxID=2841507 RepID=A0ABS6G1B1_9FIRM|nr:nucleotide sugar dehydrogenase [Alkaliphilus flagellatus]MBU5675150.1 nucleotide sugar dehydrogenase [Alkaliphilus flagellatus]